MALILNHLKCSLYQKLYLESVKRYNDTLINVCLHILLGIKYMNKKDMGQNINNN